MTSPAAPTVRPGAKTLSTRTGAALLVLLLGLFALPGTAMAGYHPQDMFVAFTSQITPPRGYTSMCAAQPELCSASLAPGKADLSNDLRLLDRVNRLVNHVVRQREDRRTYGRDDVWNPSGGRMGATGDCEDIALQKRIELVQAGYPADRLFLAVGYGRRIGLHVVLMARTDSGDLVLDSREADIHAWRETPYQWIGAQSTSDPAQWYGIRSA